ncbi:EAP30/Vps36 family-domain-containing protein [Roridomyces roridus]|uniref:Vacuolar protein-sorting-associated protein 36 n=1 Tax=Roridomyces roridus TaxID=1738132 RepID=A0AAD7FIP1_9AGAR|nr:EAP30/Vps36 family-domain-containing protein [Roridomyces roridus]
MALRRFTQTVDGTIPISALLYNDEELLASQEETQKSANHQSGTVHVTTHRLFYISADHPWAHSFSLDLAYVNQTDYYAGLFKSSAKITLFITGSASVSTAEVGTNEGPGWECQVCAYRNPPGLSPAAARVCGLCGVSRDSIPGPARQQLSSSLPASNSMPSLLPKSTPTGSHRRLPSTIACTACTFLNHPSLRECEICGTELPQLGAASPAPLSMKSAPSSRPPSPDSTDDDDGDESSVRMIKVSFRKGGDKPFYAVLRRSLKSKAWVVHSGTPSSNDISAGTDARSGITGILRTVETAAQGRESDMTDAFQDLEALSVKARDMVKLAAELNERLTAASAATSAGSTISPSSGAEPEEATFIRSSLSQLGLEMANAPVTLDMMKDERRWVEELARELAGVLQGKTTTGREAAKGMMRERGIIALDEVWGGWNRARGVALIPPATLLQVIPQLPAYTTPPINLRIFSSGLRVLHTPPYTPAAFAARLSGLLALSGPQTITEIATEEKLSVALAGEMVGDVEREGGVCRDDEGCMIKGGGTEVRYSGNVFLGYVWDGQKQEDLVY